MLTTADVATRAGVTVSAVHQWVNAGKITPATQLAGIRGPLLFDPEEVDRLLDEMATEAEAKAARLREAAS
jgi:DNA-binding transcriptional MerR regulator